MSDLDNIIGIQRKRSKAKVFLQKSLKNLKQVNLAKVKKNQLFGTSLPVIENPSFNTELKMHATMKNQGAFRDEYGECSNKQSQRHESNLIPRLIC